MGNAAGGGPQGGYTPQTQGWGGVGGMSTNAQALPPQAQGNQSWLGRMPSQAQGVPQGGPPQGMPPQAQGVPQGGPPQEAMMANAIREQAPSSPITPQQEQQMQAAQRIQAWNSAGRPEENSPITPARIDIAPGLAGNTVSQTQFAPGSIQEQRINDMNPQRRRREGYRR